LLTFFSFLFGRQTLTRAHSSLFTHTHCFSSRHPPSPYCNAFSYLMPINIFYNYLFKFKIIRTGNYERPFMRSTLSNKNSDMMLEPNGLCQVSRRKLISWSNLSISPTTRTSQLTFISYGVICKLSQLHRSILHFSLIFNAYVV